MLFYAVPHNCYFPISVFFFSIPSIFLIIIFSNDMDKQFQKAVRGTLRLLSELFFEQAATVL